MIIGFFGKLGELIGRQIELDTPSDVRTVDELKQWLSTAYPAAASEFSAARLKAAIDDVMVPGSTEFADAHHVEFFPPVSGG